MAATAHRIVGKCTVRIYRDSTLIYSGDIYGSRQIPHVPPTLPDGTPIAYNYFIHFIPTGQFGGYTSQRTVTATAFKR